MKRVLFVLATVLVLTGSAHALDLESLCGDFATLKNPDTKIYRGKFEVTHPGPMPVREAALVMVEITGTSNVLLFQAGDTRGGGQYCLALLGSLEGQTLNVRSPFRGVTNTYTFDEEGGAFQKYRRVRRNGKLAFEGGGKLQLDE
jgi:hypothetical protein